MEVWEGGLAEEVEAVRAPVAEGSAWASGGQLDATVADKEELLPSCAPDGPIGARGLGPSGGGVEFFCSRLLGDLS